MLQFGNPGEACAPLSPDGIDAERPRVTALTLERQVDLLRCGLPDVLFLEGTRSEGLSSVTLTGGPDEFMGLMTRLQAPVVLLERFTLQEDHFSSHHSEETWSPEDLGSADLLEAPALQAFHARLGEELLVVLSVPYAGLLLGLELTAPWWTAFLEARSWAIELRQGEVAAQAQSRQLERQARRDREVTLLRALLPNDAKFRALACEAKPRITALRRQAEAVLRSQVPEAAIHIGHDEAVREIAAAIKADARAAQRRS